QRTIDAAFSLGIDPTTAFPPEPIVRGLDNNLEALTISSTLAREYMDAAETVSASAVTSLARLTGCADTQLDTDGCVRAFISTKGKILWRRALTAAEQDSLVSLFATWKSTPGSDVATAYRVVIERFLDSPNFLYRPELGAPGDPGQVVALASSELAA